VRQPYTYYRPSMNWAEPDWAHATQLLRTVRTQPNEARARAAEAAKRLNRDFSLDAIGQLAKRRLNELLRRCDHAKWERLDHADRTAPLRPPVPIPSDWFDADYFDNGLKSNWKNGYHWRDFAGLFRATAEFLVTMFPEARSFVDAGCAKGFLVRALREKGKDAWGFDHSAWALAHAEELAKPFLRQASAESVKFDRTFDLTVGFSLLENLTEDQANRFIQNAKGWTNHALVLVIDTREEEVERKQLRSKDCDLAHITLRSRAWWDGRLLAAGWKRDAVHRVAERACQRQELPMKMDWRLFVYAPS
jgi:SAM-dependent methyltransferase